jgi:hypothetical protein
VAKVQGGLILASERFPVAFLNRLIEKIAEELNEPATERSRFGMEMNESASFRIPPAARVTGMFEWFAQRAESSAVVRHSACRARRDAVCRWEINW